MQLINQLPKPFIIMGDMSALSAMWGDTSRNDKWKIVEEVALEANVIVMNNRTRHITPAKEALSYRFNNMFSRLPIRFHVRSNTVFI